MVKCVSLFSGAGGLDLGASRAGLEVVACVENDPDAAQTLRQNKRHINAEVYQCETQDLCFDGWLNGSTSVLIGGPPCQPFSKNGYWIKNDNRLIQKDPRNLLGEYLRALSEMKPTGFLFENVESILHPTNKEGFFAFVHAAEALGYSCTISRVNAADFGVPQKRKRVFVFGVKNHRNPMPQPEPTHMAPGKKDLLSNLPEHNGVGPYIEKFRGAEYQERQEDPSDGTYYRELLHVPAGRNYMALSQILDYEGRTFRNGSRFWNFLQKLHPDEPSITIAAQPGPWVGPFHWDNRRLRVPEIAAIQTFPETYTFAGNRRAIQKQIGNAVPCELAEKMVNHLLEHL